MKLANGLGMSRPLDLHGSIPLVHLPGHTPLPLLDYLETTLARHPTACTDDHLKPTMDSKQHQQATYSDYEQDLHGALSPNRSSDEPCEQPKVPSHARSNCAHPNQQLEDDCQDEIGGVYKPATVYKPAP